MTDITGLVASDVHLFLADPPFLTQMVVKAKLQLKVLRPQDLQEEGGADTTSQALGATGEDPVIIRASGANTCIQHLEKAPLSRQIVRTTFLGVMHEIETCSD